jgi:hypothetical protein
MIADELFWQQVTNSRGTTRLVLLASGDFSKGLNCSAYRRFDALRRARSERMLTVTH